jgi:hypothetical protein
VKVVVTAMPLKRKKKEEKKGKETRREEARVKEAMN